MRKRSKISPRGWSIALLSVVGLLVLYVISRAKTSSSQAPREVIKSKLRNYFTRPIVAEMWVAISDFETGTWTSPLFKNYNNAFGMKQPVQRPTLSVGPTPSGFASFKSVSDSVDDLILYLKARNYPRDFYTLDDLIKYMKEKQYFEEPIDYYLKGVEQRYLKDYDA